MRKVLLILILVALLLVIAFYLILFLPGNNENRKIQDNANGKDNEAINNNNITEQNVAENNEENQGGGGDQGSESGSAGSQVIENTNPTGSCILIRPGNIPDIACQVNYIEQSGISLKIKNELGEKINIIIKIDTCTPEVQNQVETGNSEDFVFSCNNEDYFNQAILVTYILSENKKVEIGGFVSGEVV